MNYQELVDLFEQIQARPGMYFPRDVQFWMLAGYIYGMEAAGVNELKGFQDWVAREFLGVPRSSVCWDAIISHSVTQEWTRLTLTDEETQEAFDRALSSLIAYCRSRVES